MRRLSQFFKSLLTIDPAYRVKLICLSFAFFCIIGGYTVTRTLKDALFISIVGREYIPLVRMWAILMLVPGVLLFSKLVDVVRRYQLLYIYSVVYGVGGIIIAYLLQHPTIGLANPVPSPGRLFGWFIYLFIEGYNPFLVGVFWSFVHSITSPSESKGGYPIIVAMSKLGGMVTASVGYYLLTSSLWGAGYAGEVLAHQALLVGASLLVLLVPLAIYLLTVFVPYSQLHGYEVAYQAERVHDDAFEKPKGLRGTLYSVFSGLILMFQYPYVLGMFGIAFFWEVINSFVSFERLAVAHDSISSKTSYLLQQDFMIHAGGFIFAILGTRILVELLGERKSLVLVPLVTGVLLAYYFSAQSAASMAVVYVLLRVMNFAFAVPLRERLYTLTTKTIKFKSKSWIDSFGVKLAKGAGSGYNMLMMSVSQSAQVSLSVVFFSTIIGMWTIVAHAMGKSFERKVARNEAVGVDAK